MKKLPDDLAVLEAAELSEQRALRDDELAPLFQRWPALNRLELRRLRRMYAERLRIARYVGRVRARRAPKDEAR
jgi:S-adenosylmethionine:diacylglycerol 3-amino-3-carboxypropyl transferase